MSPLYLATILTAGLAAGMPGDALSDDNVGVVGLFPGKAVLVVNGSAPKTYSTGAQVTAGIRLLSVGDSSATVEINGRRQKIPIGGQVMHSGGRSGSSSAVMTADSRGHFMADVLVNGGTMSMMVDTGATMIALPAKDALRLGIDYRKGEIGQVNTANGTAPVYCVKLDTVRVGDIELHQIDALVHENGLGIGLLGMSFLNRTAMQRDGNTMTLTKRY